MRECTGFKERTCLTERIWFKDRMLETSRSVLWSGHVPWYFVYAGPGASFSTGWSQPLYQRLWAFQPLLRTAGNGWRRLYLHPGRRWLDRGCEPGISGLEGKKWARVFERGKWGDWGRKTYYSGTDLKRRNLCGNPWRGRGQWSERRTVCGWWKRRQQWQNSRSEGFPPAVRSDHPTGLCTSGSGFYSGKSTWT